MSQIDNLSQLSAWQPAYRPDAIIDDGILLPGTVMQVFGSAGTWKTMSAIHLAFCIAQGIEWFGFRTTAATVFMHQVELPKVLMRDRIVKYANSHTPSAIPNIFFKTPDDDVLIDTTYGLMSLTKDLDEVRKRVPENNSLVVFLDPLYLHMAGHISDEYEVKKFQRGINSLRKSHKATFIIIHHSRLTRCDSNGNVLDLGAEELMGSSYWNNWLDTIVRGKLMNPSGGSDIVQYSFEKTRNAQKFLPSFKVKWHRHNLQPEVIWRDTVSEDDVTVRHLT